MDRHCAEHVRGFEHFDVDGVAPNLHLGVKFEQQESEDSVVAPSTGSRAWAEPLLVMSVSVQHTCLSNCPTLRYGLTRSKFRNGIVAGEDDKEHLRSKAEPHVLADTAALLSGDVPDAALRVVMVQFNFDGSDEGPE